MLCGEVIKRRKGSTYVGSYSQETEHGFRKIQVTPPQTHSIFVLFRRRGLPSRQMYTVNRVGTNRVIVSSVLLLVGSKPLSSPDKERPLCHDRKRRSEASRTRKSQGVPSQTIYIKMGASRVEGDDLSVYRI